MITHARALDNVNDARALKGRWGKRSKDQETRSILHPLNFWSRTDLVFNSLQMVAEGEGMLKWLWLISQWRNQKQWKERMINSHRILRNHYGKPGHTRYKKRKSGGYTRLVQSVWLGCCLKLIYPELNWITDGRFERNLLVTAAKRNSLQQIYGRQLNGELTVNAFLSPDPFINREIFQVVRPKSDSHSTQGDSFFERVENDHVSKARFDREDEWQMLVRHNLWYLWKQLLKD